MPITTPLAWLTWDPHPDAFVIPYLNHPVKWYGILFVTGFIIGFWILIPIFSKKVDSFRPLKKELNSKTSTELSVAYVDKLTWMIVIGTIIGARLGHVFFYEWPYYRHHWIDIFKVWEGGLASHGGGIGVLIAIYLHYKWNQSDFPKLTFLSLLDMLVIPISFTFGCIRLGNFMNQEILGTATTLPWAIIFLHPIDGSFPQPRHPVQLYEAFAYFALFSVLWLLWKTRGNSLSVGFLSGLFFIWTCTARFLMEFLKVPQGHMIDESFLQTGQYLSIPFIFLGLYILFFYKKTINLNN